MQFGSCATSLSPADPDVLDLRVRASGSGDGDCRCRPFTWLPERSGKFYDATDPSGFGFPKHQSATVHVQQQIGVVKPTHDVGHGNGQPGKRVACCFVKDPYLLPVES